MDEAIPVLRFRRKAAAEPSVDLVFGENFADEHLSDRELDALCPILPELVSELLMMSADSDNFEE